MLDSTDNFTSRVAMVFSCACLLCFVATNSWSYVIEESGGNATGILGLDVDGTLYDVTFGHTFTSVFPIPGTDCD